MAGVGQCHNFTTRAVGDDDLGGTEVAAVV